eukprot:GEMP01017680.1.p1 GENE.GEMP01017680.1~~GEMP01017680.1.p1  ORF type:complete len:318 (+),score=59.73 GEMP01017680.1:288-1241(+)
MADALDNINFKSVLSGATGSKCPAQEKKSSQLAKTHFRELRRLCDQYNQNAIQSKNDKCAAFKEQNLVEAREEKHALDRENYIESESRAAAKVQLRRKLVQNSFREQLIADWRLPPEETGHSMPWDETAYNISVKKDRIRVQKSYRDALDAQVANSRNFGRKPLDRDVLVNSGCSVLGSGEVPTPRKPSNASSSIVAPMLRSPPDVGIAPWEDKPKVASAEEQKIIEQQNYRCALDQQRHENVLRAANGSGAPSACHLSFETTYHTWERDPTRARVLNKWSVSRPVPEVPLSARTAGAIVLPYWQTARNDESLKSSG